MPIEKEIYAAPSLKEDVRLASESAEEEAEMELMMLLKQFDEWKKENKGGFKDSLDSKDDNPVRSIKLSNVGSVEDYADLIDAYIKKIDVLENETLTEYINRVRAAEAKKDD